MALVALYAAPAANCLYCAHVFPLSTTYAAMQLTSGVKFEKTVMNPAASIGVCRLIYIMTALR